MAKRHISPLTLRDVWDKLEQVEMENKKTKCITLTALGFAVFAVTIPMFLELFPSIREGIAIVVVVYASAGAYLYYKAYEAYKQIKNLEGEK